jgi:hypothetical protein
MLDVLLIQITYEGRCLYVLLLPIMRLLLLNIILRAIEEHVCLDVRGTQLILEDGE